jgi:hypothetical protein
VVGGGVPKWVELGRPIEQPGHSMASA